MIPFLQAAQTNWALSSRSVEIYYTVLLQSKMASSTLWKGERFPGFLFPMQFNFKSHAQFHFQSALRENVI